MKSTFFTQLLAKSPFARRSTIATTALIFSLLLASFPASASAAPAVYVITASQQFGMVDLATGKFHSIGKGTPDALSNLVWWDDRTLLTLVTTGSNAGSLAKINPVDGVETVIAQITFQGQPLGFNAFDLGEVGGKLYLTDFSNNLYSVDPETGVATLIAATGMPPDPTAPFTFNADGTFNLCDEGLYNVGGKLYATFDSFDLDPAKTPPPIAHVHVSPALYQIDPATGLATFVAETDLQLSALFVAGNGKFYAFRAVLDGFDAVYDFPIAHAELVTLDLATGKTTKLTDIDHSIGPIFGAAPIRLAHWMLSQ